MKTRRMRGGMTPNGGAGAGAGGGGGGSFLGSLWTGVTSLFSGSGAAAGGAAAGGGGGGGGSTNRGEAINAARIAGAAAARNRTRNELAGRIRPRNNGAAGAGGAARNNNNSNIDPSLIAALEASAANADRHYDQLYEANLGTAFLKSQKRAKKNLGSNTKQQMPISGPQRRKRLIELVRLDTALQHARLTNDQATVAVLEPMIAELQESLNSNTNVVESNLGINDDLIEELRVINASMTNAERKKKANNNAREAAVAQFLAQSAAAAAPPPPPAAAAAAPVIPNAAALRALRLAALNKRKPNGP